ncbi:MAG: iron chelate uptake ABC transporter family permease subunit [Candidatus Bathyarchaeota archaeon]|nr:iron chelate uptake ABC transporter family permease subunit [Candidatus Bathyarchaeum tardum]WGM89975.1 MAG: iron chelate uptake ABC transporter family permease subunit [Candidatus Bathyarchaeum tardum]WNZ29887.1 MAG: iron chelate uptake ABC transporter family permease subunit [Candidatus Bathyarchaeota archaeon]
MTADAETKRLRNVSRWKLYLLILVAVFAAVFVLSLNLGYAPIPFRDILNILGNQVPLLNTFIDASGVDPTYAVIISQIRLPRVICGALVGAALATAGVTYQGIFRNPMADPYVIGASTGASVGSALVFVFGINIAILGLNTLPVFAFVGSLVTVLIVYTISRVGSKVPVTTLLLTGIAMSLFQNAIVTYLKTVAGDRILHGLTFWLIGSLSSTENWDKVYAILPFIIVGSVICYLYSRDLNILALGEDQAQHLGVEIEKVKRILLVAGALMTAAAVSISGLIGFVGLIIPHVTRVLIGPDHRVLIPTSALVGASFLMISDAISRVIMGSGEAPVGIITAFAGAPFFIYLLRRKNKGYKL